MSKLNNLLKDPNFYEIVGAFIGDGCLANFGRTEYVEFYGNPVRDKEYMEHIRNIIKTTLGIEPNIKIREGAIRFRYTSPEFVKILKDVGFSIGRKDYKVQIPKIMCDNGWKYIKHTLRGIIDTDGYVYLDTRKIYKKTYPRVDITTKSYKLFKQINDLLKEQGFRPYEKTISLKGETYYRMELYGHEQAERWSSEIGFSNKKHRDKMPQ